MAKACIVLQFSKSVALTFWLYDVIFFMVGVSLTLEVRLIRSLWNTCMTPQVHPSKFVEVFIFHLENFMVANM